MAIRLVILLGLVAVFACSKKSDVQTGFTPLSSTGNNRLLVVATDMQVGLLNWVNLSLGSLERTGFPVGTDSIVRFDPVTGRTFVVNRGGASSISVFEKGLTGRLAEYSVGAGTNPQDIAVISESLAYVSRLEKTSTLLKIDPRDGRVIGGKVLPTSLSDEDGVPEMAWMERVDSNKLWLSLQRLTQWEPKNESYLVQLSLADDSLQHRVLARSNPVTQFKRGPDGKLYVGEAGYTGYQSRLDGGIEKWNADTFTSEGLVIDEQTLGGDIVDFEILSQDVGVAIIANPNTELLVFNPRTGKKGNTLSSSAAYDYFQITLDRERGLFYVGDRNNRQPSVRVWSMDSLQERTDLKWEMGRAPYHMTLAH